MLLDAAMPAKWLVVPALIAEDKSRKNFVNICRPMWTGYFIARAVGGVQPHLQLSPKKYGTEYEAPRKLDMTSNWDVSDVST